MRRRLPRHGTPLEHDHGGRHPGLACDRRQPARGRIGSRGTAWMLRHADMAGGGPVTCSGAGARSCVTTVLRAVRDRLAAWAPRRRLTRERAWTSNVPVAGPGGAFVLAWIDDDPPIGRTSTGGALPPTSESVIGRQCWEVRADPTKMGWAVSGRPGGGAAGSATGVRRGDGALGRGRAPVEIDTCGTGEREPRPRSRIRPMVPKNLLISKSAQQTSRRESRRRLDTSEELVELRRGSASRPRAGKSHITIW